MVKLSPEIAEALQSADGRPLTVEVPGTDRAYVLVDSAIHQAAMAALRRQREAALIREGLDDIEAGRTQPIMEASAEIRAVLKERFSSGAPG
jgi:predicted transcriptional regulator